MHTPSVAIELTVSGLFSRPFRIIEYACRWLSWRSRSSSISQQVPPLLVSRSSVVENRMEITCAESVWVGAFSSVIFLSGNWRLAMLTPPSRIAV
ncbi:hypothetical protein SCLCIDRAFT_923148 [Scleroderma citrinum Foug A]|uniref:Uncharacterized protein n=1 Tax=Scleroderma citrinum Foug A TaxID=1036808 RepID=A0A0C3A7N3_9AGAM|nr:hypothetical protein SCLCIDRAFT_923148 [Scleroderma citrinum Foug A]